MSKYSNALGINQTPVQRVRLDPGSMAEWAVSKVPAALGGHLGVWAYEWAIKKWPSHPRGAEFVGSMGVIVAAFGLELAAQKWAPEYARLAEKVTDGMIGRAGPVLTRMVRKLLGLGDATPKAAQGVEPASLDGDAEAVRDVARLLRDSPQTVDEMAQSMAEIMDRDGVEMNDAGRNAVVRSMREVTARLARS